MWRWWARLLAEKDQKLAKSQKKGCCRELDKMEKENFR